MGGRDPPRAYPRRFAGCFEFSPSYVAGVWLCGSTFTISRKAAPKTKSKTRANIAILGLPVINANPPIINGPKIEENFPNML